MRVLILTLFLFLFTLSYGQEYTFRSYSVAEGLPQSQVTCITQDSKGFLWVGTLGGLARFSGREFETFSVDNGLLNNRISFVGHINDTLWIGHENGVSRKSGKKFIAYDAKHLQEGIKFSAIIEFKGRKLMASNGGGLFELNGNDLVKSIVRVHGIDEIDEFNRIRDLLVVNDTLYVATRMGVFYSIDGTKYNLLLNTDDYSFSSLKWDTNYGLVMATYGDGVLYIKKGRLKVFKNSNEIAEGHFKHLYLDHNHRVWLSTKFDGAFRIGQSETMQLSTNNGFPLDNISCVFEDNSRTIWIGTEGKGLVRFAGEAFTHYTSSSGLVSDLIVSVVQDAEGALWFGSYVNGISRFYKGAWQTIDISNSRLSNNTVWCSLVDHENNLWFGTGNGINIFRDGKIEVWDSRYHPELLDNKISALFQDSKNRIWIGGKDGISIYDNGKIAALKNINSDAKKLFNVRNFTEYQGVIYFASQNGFHVFTKDEKLTSFELSSSKPTVYSVESDITGSIWIGTEEGIYIFRNGKIEHLQYAEFSGSNFVNFIVAQHNSMWVGTNNGLFRFSNIERGLDKMTVDQFGISEGLVSLETNINSAYIDKDENLWFGSSEGLIKFNKDKENQRVSTIAPVLTFNSISVNYQKLSLDEWELNSEGIPADLLLSFNQNRLVFNFTGVTMSNPESLMYQFFLDGVNDDWSPPTPNSEVTFSNLSPGNYTLKARAVSKYGVLSNEIEFPFVIKSPFYATWWFISLCVIFVASIVYGVFRFQIQQERNRRKSESLEFTSKLRGLEQQSLNASMNRHFIFNALNSIQYFINTQDKLSANKYLSQFAKLIRKNLDSSTTESNNVALSEEIERLELYLSLESMRFKDRFDYVFDIDPSIDTEELKIPSMIFQPFMENSIIHGILPRQDVKGLIKFTATREGDIINFIIEDNGIGYEKSMRHKVETGDHQSRGMSITSSRIELLRKISGKTFQLIGPVDIINDTGESIGTRVHIKIHDESLVDSN